MERIQMKDLTIIEISREQNIFLTQSGEAREKNNMDVNASKNIWVSFCSVKGQES
jgi:hypothetical protein